MRMPRILPEPGACPAAVTPCEPCWSGRRRSRRGAVMHLSRTAVIVCCLSAVLAAQSGKKFVRPLPGQTPPYSLGITAGGVIYVAGQLPTDDKGNLVTGDFAAQT